MLKNKSAFLKRARMISGLLLTFVVAFTCFTACDGSDDMMLQAGNGNSALDDYVGGLNYDTHEVVGFKGNTVMGEVVPKEGYFDGDTYVVKSNEKCVDSGTFNPVVPQYYNETIYPGALIYANDGVLKGEPKLIDAKRGAVTLRLNLPGMDAAETTKVVSDATYANVSNATNEILNKWYEKNGGFFNFKSEMKCKQGLIYDEKTLQLKFGCNIDFLQRKFKVDLDRFKKGEECLYLVEYAQEFYTATISRFLSPSEAFAESVTHDELIFKGVNSENPPAYVSSVTYGRRFYILFRSSAKPQDLEGLLKDVFSDYRIEGIRTENKDKYSDVIGRTSYFTAGDEMDSDMVELKFLDEPLFFLNSEINTNTRLTNDRSAAPLTYDITFLKEIDSYNFYGSTEYLKQTYENHPSGALNILHSGAYPAKIYVTWDEIIGYDSSGNENVTNHEWDQNGETKGAGFKTSIPLGGNCCNVSIKVKGYSGLKYQPWFNSFEKTGLAVVPNREIVIRGTTLKQTITCDPAK